MSNTQRTFGNNLTTDEKKNKIHVFQGHYEVSNDPEMCFATILGSCVSCCLRDPVAGVGGMNHFLVPGDQREGKLSASHGVHAMELLINGLLKLGAERRRFEAKLFGGAHVVSGVSDIGKLNSAFAIKFLQEEGIACVGQSLGGVSARRIQFWPVTGRARQLLVPISAAPVVEEAPKAGAEDTGDLELF